MDRHDGEAAEPSIIAMLDSITDGVLAVDTAWRFTYVNSQGERLARQTRGDLMGRIVWDVFPELVGTLFESEARRALAEGTSAVFDAFYPAYAAWFHVRLYPSATGLVVLFQDVTTRTLALQAVEESEQRLRQAADAADVGTWRMDLRTNLDTRDASFNRILGLPAVESTQPVDDFVARVHPSDRPAVVAAIERTIAECGIYDCDCRIVRPDGLVRFIRDRGRVIRGEDGEPRYITGAVIDITERRQAEESQRFLAGASRTLAASLDYTTTLDAVAHLALPHFADLCVVDIIEAGALRHVALAHVDPAKEEILRELRRRYQPDLSWAGHPLIEVLRTGQSILIPEMPAAMRVAAARDEEHLRLMEILNYNSYIVVPLLVQGRTLGTISLVRTRPEWRYGPDDLALAEELARRAARAIEHAQLYQTTQEALHARDQFLSIAAHELKTPLTGIKSAAQLLLRGLDRRGPEEERLGRLLSIIDERTNHLTRLVHDLLDVSRLRLGQLPIRRQPLDLSAFVGTVVTRFYDHVEERHQVLLEACKAPCPVLADDERLEQVLSNLLDNAVKYSPEGGTIRVTVHPEGEGMQVQVCDQGIGLPARAAETIFEPFGRATNAERRQLPGLGLGLYISRQIVARHGGRLWAESKGEDQGTTFFLWLPAPAEEEPVPN